MHSSTSKMITNVTNYPKNRPFGNTEHNTSKTKVREKSRECHNYKPQAFPDTKRKRKPTNPNKHKYMPRTYLYNFDPLKPHFYIVKLGLTGVYIIFLIAAQKHRSWVLVRTASPNEYPQSMFSAEILKISDFFCENFHF